MVEVGEGVREMSMKKELALHLGTDQLLRDSGQFRERDSPDEQRRKKERFMALCLEAAIRTRSKKRT